LPNPKFDFQAALKATVGNPCVTNIAQIHISTIKMSSSLTLRAILFHGNCPDGLACAHLLSQECTPDSQFFPVSPSDPKTWPDPASLVGHEIIFADVCFSVADMAPYQEVAKALGSSVLVLDHHPLAATVVANGGYSPKSVTTTGRCAAWHVHEYLYPGQEIPLWLQFLDGIDNWRGITDEHKALRELWHPIARAAVKDASQAAILEFSALVKRMNTEGGWAAAFAEGLVLWRKKERILSDQLDAAPRRFIRGVLPTWIGNVYVTNTGRQFIGPAEFDSTAASELVFAAHKDINVFLNYHEVRWLERSKGERGVQQRKFVFHARARDGSGVDLTTCPILKGHAAAAGGQVIQEHGKLVPFVF